jgi:ribosomal protein L11 methyltransferase
MSIKYRLFSFKVKPLKIVSEILIAELSELGFESFEETNIGIDAYIENEKWKNSFLKDLSVLSNSNFEIDYSSKIIHPKNWNKIWESSFKPILIAKNCVVRADFHSKFNLKYEIIITPKMSFGTGHHETTSMIMNYILDLNVGDLKVLDVGSGTGILSILSEKNGASIIDAVDIDKLCFENTKENIYLNDCKLITAYCGDITLFRKSKYDLILANINKNIIMSNIFIYNDLLNTGGQLIISGFYDNDFVDINNIAKSLKLEFVSKKVNNLWASIHYIKN